MFPSVIYIGCLDMVAEVALTYRMIGITRAPMGKFILHFFNEFDKIVSKGPHDIGNCLTIEHAIRLTTDVPVVGMVLNILHSKIKIQSSKYYVEAKNNYVSQNHY